MKKLFTVFIIVSLLNSLPFSIIQAGQISVVNPSAGSSVVGVAVSLPSFTSLSPQINNIGVLPMFKGQRNTQKPSVLLEAARNLLVQNLMDIDVAQFSSQQKQILTAKIKKSLRQANLDNATKNFLQAELNKLASSFD